VSLSEPAWQPGYPIDLRGEAVARRDADGPYGDFEYRAARVVARATGERVVLQDDNLRPRTPDLRIEYADGRRGVVEIVTVTDGQRAAESAAFADGGLDLQIDALRWQSWVTAPASVDRRRLQGSLAKVLAQMEAANERPSMLTPIDPATAGPGALKLLSLGVTAVAANNAPGERRGHVHWQPEGIGGELDLDLASVERWLRDFLRGPLAAKKFVKLLAVSDVSERHLFVGISWSVPWAVIRLLDLDVAALPPRPPSLPAGISHLWMWGCELPDRALAWWPDRGWFDVARRWATE
jgi:hypothetical protein